MIRIFLGNVGSGKTASAVRDMCMEKRPLKIYSNIITKGIKNNIQIKSDMIIKKIDCGQKRNGETIYKYEFNKEYWIDAVKDLDIVSVYLDEVHTLLDARRAMSKPTKCALDFLALIRRIIQQNQYGSGKLTMISQLSRRIDVIAKEMSTQIRYHVCHYLKTCQSCGFIIREHNEAYNIADECPRCKDWHLKKSRFVIEVWEFKNAENFFKWKYDGVQTRYCCERHYYITDIQNYFKKYDSYQWDSLLSDI